MSAAEKEAAVLKQLGPGWRIETAGACRCLINKKGQKTETYHSIYLRDGIVRGQVGARDEALLDAKHDILSLAALAKARDTTSTSASPTEQVTSALGSKVSTTTLVLGSVAAGMLALSLLGRYLLHLVVVSGVLFITKPEQQTFAPWFQQQLKNQGDGKLKAWFKTKVVFSADSSQHLDLIVCRMAKLPNTDPPAVFLGLCTKWVRLW